MVGHTNQKISKQRKIWTKARVKNMYSLHTYRIYISTCMCGEMEKEGETP